MVDSYTQEKIENWAVDFCGTDAVNNISPGLRDVAEVVLATFLAAACTERDLEPEELEEADVRESLCGTMAAWSLDDDVRGEVPGLCGAFLAWLQDEGRLSGGRVMGAAMRALRESYLTASGKMKPIVRAGSKLGRNDPCPCGSGRKFKKCCMGEQAGAMGELD